MTLIRIGNLIINAALLVEALFQPATPETAELHSISAKLYLRFAAHQSEPRTDHNGDYTGSDDHSPYERILRGEEAEAVWNQLCEEVDE